MNFTSASTIKRLSFYRDNGKTLKKRQHFYMVLRLLRKMERKETSQRYSRQKLLKEIGPKGQKLLNTAKVIIIGVGALGTTTANLLVRAGVGTIGLVDRDIIELHNLQRQTIFTEEDCNKPKAEVAAMWLRKTNSTIKIEVYPLELNHETGEMLKNYDLILDCTDNMETRFLMNDFCVKNKKQWIYCSAVGTKGRLFTIIPNKTPCFRCLFAVPKPGSLETCDTAGVLNTITTTIAAMQVTEAVKLLTNQTPAKELLAFDIWKQELQKIKVKSNPKCICCKKKKYEFLDGNKETVSIKLCGQGRIQIKGRTPNVSAIRKRLEQNGTVKETQYGLHFTNNETDFFLFNDGRCLIKAVTKEEAKNIYSKWVGN